ncbi:hypothetical protein KUTeg_023866 [Tegillarca granosa]|uniref:EGF-like domain-containing protein n=1 Tax=Tegillarca granosa TaxID=220873 RepID=A0ABQ9E5V1_TEGGR|nr:hypothetical protein KUTeg_023866 [Tegillarca granosa]
MGNSFIVYIVICSLFVLIIKADDTCYKTKSKSKKITQTYYVMHKTTTRTCWGLNWFAIKCRQKTIERPYLKTRSIYTTEYEIEPRCCVGYTKNGTHCQKGCDRGQYGEDCNKKCNCSNTPNTDGYCNRTTGECICNSGWLGENCSQSCPDGYFGQNCESVCQCSNNATCNTTDGSCNCTVPGWTGENCDEECYEGFYGLNCSESCTCNNNQTCDSYTGSCSCKAGRTGQNCTQVCKNNTFGPDCKSKCGCDPDGTSYCDPINGTCECKAGKSGRYCYQDCPHGQYGVGCQEACNCSKENEYCNPENGTCMSLCICNKEGTSNCEDKVDNCTCNKILNETQCYQNHHSHYQRFEQSDANMLDLCACRFDGDQLCVPANRSCVCKSGYSGRHCRKTISNPKGQTKGDGNDKGRESVIIGVIIAVVLIFVWTLIISGIFCRMKRKKMEHSTNNPIYNLNDQHDNGFETVTNSQGNKTYDINQYSQAANINTDTDVNEKEKETSFKNNMDEELYNKTNRDEHESVNSETQNLYSHTNTKRQEDLDIDEAYDLMEHNKHQEIQDDTYDHTNNIESEYDTVNNKG